MSTFSHSLDRVRVRKLQLVRTDARVTANSTPEEFIAKPDDGLGAIRGLALAMMFNAAIALPVTGAWELWRLFR